MFEFAKFCQLFKTCEISTFEFDFKPYLGHMFKLKVLLQLERLGNQIKSVIFGKKNILFIRTSRTSSTHAASTLTTWAPPMCYLDLYFMLLWL